MKWANGLSACDLIRATKVMFAEFGLPKIVSDAGNNFVSDQFKQFSRQRNIDQAITSSDHHHSSGKVEAYIKFVKCTI